MKLTHAASDVPHGPIEMATTEMEILHNPSETRPLEDWFRSIGIVTKNEAAWMKFYYSILAIAAATSVQLLRKMREPDIDLALANCELSNGYKHALCEFLVPRGKKPFAFCSPALAKPEGKKRTYLKNAPQHAPPQPRP